MVDAIVEAAARILESEGIGACTTNAIAARAGVSIGSLYQYFPSVEAILCDLTRRERARFAGRLERAAEAVAGMELGAAVAELVAVAVEQQLDRPELARVLDFIEPGLGLDEETMAMSGEIGALVERVLRERNVARSEQAARDLAALGKGMIDAAGMAGERAHGPLRARVIAASLGYLERMEALGAD